MRYGLLWPRRIARSRPKRNGWASESRSRSPSSVAFKQGRSVCTWALVTEKAGDCPGYGRFGVFPAQIIIESFRDIEVRVNPQSSYDYANMYHGLPYEAVFQGHCCPKQGQE